MVRQKRCGCVSGQCDCAIVGGPSVALSGDGSVTRPIQIDATLPQTKLLGDDTPSLNMTVSGSGTAGDPFVVTGTADPSAAGVIVSTFTRDSTWFKPNLAALVTVTVVGGGAGGAPGTAASSGFGGTLPGGLGGLAAQSYSMQQLASELPATAPVTVGVGGSSGSDGTGSRFGNTLLFAAGGVGRYGGPSADMPPGTGGQGGDFIGFPDDPDAGWGRSGYNNVSSGSTVPGGVGSDGVPGSSLNNPLGSGAGGGGAYVNAPGDGGSGGNGAYGSGGGGGASCQFGSNPGLGGRGGDGVVIVMVQ